VARGREATTAPRAAGEKKGEPEAEAKAEVTGGDPGAGSGMPDLDFVRGLIQAVDSSGIDSLEITRAGTRVKISKTPPSSGAQYFAPAAPPAPAPPPAAAPAATPAGGNTAGPASEGDGGAAAAQESSSGLVDITSPMVGTFYRAPAPEAPPYVEVGSRVSKGQTLCILEAMKLMNELESEAEGTIREILVENAEPVEYGQVLFRIDPTG
jgi:acetyl-CoA carboxylase biotin carboxyl carrier protein